MSRDDKHSIPADLQEIAKRLEAERPQASDLELDRMKLMAMSAASRAVRRARPGIGSLLRSGRLVTIALAFVLMVGGGAVLASSGGPSSFSSHESASKKEYEDDDCGQDEKGRNKSKNNDFTNVCQQCDKASSNRTVTTKNGDNNGSSDCKPQCDSKTVASKTVTTKTGSNGSSDCKPQCDSKTVASKTVTTKTGSNGNSSDCKPRS